MPNRKFFSKHVTTSGSSIPVTAKSAYVNSVVITCSVAGGTITIADGAGNILIPAVPLNVPPDGLPNVDRTFEEPQRMRNGINIIPAGAAGTTDVQIACNVTDEE